MEFNGKFWLKSMAYILIILIMIVVFYAIGGWYQARKDAGELQQIISDMQDTELGIVDLGGGDDGITRKEWIVKVEDPNFGAHGGYDYDTAGAGDNTITQTLAENLAFENFQSGYQDIRKMGYAIGLESALSKDEIFILYLNTVRMGRFPTGWVEGFHRASKLYFRKNASELSDDEFIELIAVLIAPSELRLDKPSEKREERLARIKLLLDDECAPAGHDDIWLDGCAS